MRTTSPRWIILTALVMTAPLWAAERTGLLAPKEVKKEQEDLLKRLTDGNKRHMKNIDRKGGLSHIMIVSCADSRVPPEIVFGVKPGEIFTTRAFGNVVDKTILASLEYGAEHLNCRVLVVMGHSGCSALKEAISEHDNPRASENLWRSLNRKDLVERLQPAVNAVTNKELKDDERLDAVVRINVFNTMRTIREKSAVLWDLEQGDMIKMVGCIYHLDSGKVEWLKE